MGNAESNPTKNIDKRTARRMYRNTFINAIDDYRENRLNELYTEHIESQHLKGYKFYIYFINKYNYS